MKIGLYNQNAISPDASQSVKFLSVRMVMVNFCEVFLGFASRHLDQQREASNGN
jgi:hypothetical protein